MVKGPISGESALWRFNNQTHVTRELVKDLGNFKSGLVNSKIALWNPQTNGVRYLKTLIYNLSAILPPESWHKIGKIENRHVGSPIMVRYHGEEICLDYLQAVLELEFIEAHFELEGSTVLEIGAGYGRTCHAIVSNHEVERYCIVDLPNCLDLTARYLREVLDRETFHKIQFILAEDFDFLDDGRFDICINIDSFAEMDVEVVQRYLSYVRSHCSCLYVKNPVGKYLDKSLDNHSEGEQVVELALNAGLIRDIIDIDDSEAVEAQAGRYLEAYQPGSEWRCIGAAWAVPWSFYRQAIFQKAGDSVVVNANSEY